MRGFVDGLAIVVLCAVIGAVGTWLIGCREPRTQDAALLAEAAAHQAELTACLDKAKRNSGLYSEYKACSMAVDERYGIAATDAGRK